MLFNYDKSVAKYLFTSCLSFLGKLTIERGATKRQNYAQRIFQRECPSLADPSICKNDDCFDTFKVRLKQATGRFRTYLDETLKVKADIRPIIRN